MNEVMWREVMGFRNMPEQRCLLQGVLNPWHAGSPLWVLGLLAGPLAGARGWLFFRRGSRRAWSRRDECVLNDARGALAAPGGARDPRGRGRPGPDCGGGELGGSAGVPRGRRTWITWERRKFVVLSSLGDPPEDALLLYVASA